MAFRSPVVTQRGVTAVRGRRRVSPAQVLVLSFTCLIAFGTLLLLLPAATHTPISFVDAVFTATSAVCVTGLTVVDTASRFTTLGQIVILLLVQLGGLGYMAITTVGVIALGRQLSLSDRLTLQQALDVDSLSGLARFVLSVLKLTLAFEVAGAAILTAWWTSDLGLGRAAYYGVFHAVTAFNNAGFVLFENSLTSFRGDVVVNFVIGTLVVAGGLGFVVLRELRHYRPGQRLSLHARLVLGLSVLLLVGGAAVIWIVEYDNPLTLAGLSPAEAAMAALFQSVTARSSGFNTIDVSAMMPASLFLLILLMFVGAAPGSTGGGVKISTFAVAVATIWSIVRGRDEPVLLGRRIPPAQVSRAFAICVIGFFALNGVAGLLLITEERTLLPTLFEATSAFATTGLSLGQAGSSISLVGSFSNPGRLLVAALMFVGRLGPLTMAVAIARARHVAPVRPAEGRFLVG
jgi:trk system potassium uptake protein TrkH